MSNPAAPTRIRLGQQAALAALALALSCGCGGHRHSAVLTPSGPAAGGGPERAVAQGLDSDSDGIPDDLELRLGTDPHAIDTDKDGLTDQYELWGCQGIGIGRLGPLTGLPDPNGNGINAALDPGDAALTARSKTALDALSATRIRVVAPGEGTVENDLDGDNIPSDFELAGFYYEIDPLTGEDWFVKWDGDYNKNYYKTDPTKWSSDADPWSDWEEATKRNMDQRVKKPGDHPCIPAYPDIQGVLVSYTVEDASKITSENGTEAKSEWTNSVSTKDELETNWGWHAGVEVENEEKWSTNVFDLPEFSATLSVTAKGGYHSGSKVGNSSTTSNDTSGLNAEEWKATTAGDTINTAKLLLNLKLINVGTLPASDAKILFNLKLGDFVIDSFIVSLDSFQGFGELEALAGNSIDYAVIDNGRRTEYVEPQPLYLSLEQLKSLHLGAPLSVELVSFEARTIVSQVDAATGRRINLDIGPWSPYQSALENTSARLLLDVGQPVNPAPVLPGEIAPRNTKEVRVFAYDNTGNYVGSPPAVTLIDGFVWGFGARADGLGPTVSFTDPISRKQRTASLANFLFGFDKTTNDSIFTQSQYRQHLFSLPLQPSNPSDRVYVAQAPPLVNPTAGVDQTVPTVYWAQLTPYQKKRVEVDKPLPRPDPSDPTYESYDPDNPPLEFDRYAFQPQFDPVVRAAVNDFTGVTDVRFVPAPGHIGQLMTHVDDPERRSAGGMYEYNVPENYVWTGFESVVAYNRDGKQSAPTYITIDKGSHLDENDKLVVGSNSDAFVYGRYTNQDPTGGTLDETTYAITASSPANDTITVDGDHVADFPDGLAFTIDGGTAQLNGTQTVVHASLSSNKTVIQLTLDLTANSSGTCHLPRTYLIDVARNFLGSDVKAGYVVKKLGTTTQCVVTAVLSATKLAVAGWNIGGTPTVAGSSTARFVYGDAYAIIKPSLAYDLLGYETEKGTDVLEVYEQASNSPSFGMQFSNTSQLKSAPFDIKVSQVTGAAGSLTINVAQAVGVGIVGVGNYDSWTYTVLRKTPLQSTDLNFWNKADGAIPDYIFAARLADGRVVKFRLKYQDFGTDRIVSSVDYTIYRGI